MYPQPSSPVTDVVLSIRALTTAIQLLQPRSTPSEPPIQAKQGSYQGLSKAYNHIAILLTQGSKADNAARQVIAVSGRFSGSGLSISALEEVGQLPPISHINFMQNPDGKATMTEDRILLDVQKISPSETTLADLADPHQKYASLSRISNNLCLLQSIDSGGSSTPTCI